MGALQVLSQSCPCGVTQTKSWSSVLQTEGETQYRDCTSLTEIGGRSVVTLEGESGTRQQRPGLLEGLVAFGHTCAQVDEVVGVPVRRWIVTLPDKRKVMYVVEPDIERGRRIGIALVDPHLAIPVATAAEDALDQVDEPWVEQIAPVIGDGLLEDHIIERLAHVVDRQHIALLRDHRDLQIREQIPGASTRAEAVADRRESLVPERRQRAVERSGDHAVEQVADREHAMTAAGLRDRNLPTGTGPVNLVTDTER
jgi:hypothetical protein